MTSRPLRALFPVVFPATLAAQEPAAVPRICLAPTSIEASIGSASSVADAVREALTSFLTGPSIAVSGLSARLESQVREEAANAGCRYVLFTVAKQQRKQGGGLLGRVAGGAVQQGAWRAASEVGGTGAGRVAVDAAAGAAGAAASDLAYSTHAKDELSLTWRLESADRKVLVDKSAKRKASTNGEDLLTPLAEQAAETVAAAVAAK